MKRFTHLWAVLLIGVISCSKPSSKEELFDKPIPVSFSFKSPSKTLKIVHIELYGCGQNGSDPVLVAVKDTLMTEGVVNLVQNRIPYIYSIVNFSVISPEFDVYYIEVANTTRKLHTRGSSCGNKRMEFMNDYLELMP